MGDQEITYGQVNEISDHVACGLLNLGIKRGDRIGINGLNTPEWLYAYFAAAKIGACVVGLTVRYRDSELEYILNQSQTETVVTIKGNTHPLEYPLEEPSWVPEYREGIIEPIIPDKNAMLQPFKRPGLGFEIDKKLLRKYSRSFYKINERRLAFKVIREKGLKAALALLRKRKEASSG